MRKIILLLPFIAILWAKEARCEIIRSTGAPDTFTYRGRSHRDPFVRLERGAESASGTNIVRSLEELEQEFDPGSYVIKAIVGGRGSAIAVIGNPANPQENYLVQGSRLKHLPTGSFLKSYVAQVQANQVIIKRVKGQPSMVAVTFPKEEESP